MNSVSDAHQTSTSPLESPLQLKGISGKPILVDFDGTQISSDGGLLLLCEVNGKQAVMTLKRLFALLREAWPNTIIIFRGDGHFSSPEALAYCEIYCALGKAELFIKDHKRHLQSDRTSCTRFEANQFRLLLHSAAYVLLHTIWAQVLRKPDSLPNAQR